MYCSLNDQVEREFHAAGPALVNCAVISNMVSD